MRLNLPIMQVFANFDIIPKTYTVFALIFMLKIFILLLYVWQIDK